MFKISKKDLKVFFSDRKGVLLTFLLPIALISLFVLAFGGMGKEKTKSKPISLPVCNMDNSKTSKKFISDLDSVKGIEIELMDTSKARQMVKKGDRVAVLIFFKGFEDSLNNGHKLPFELQYDEGRQMEMGVLRSLLISNLMKSIFPSEYNPVVDNVTLTMTPLIGEDNENNLGLVQAVAGTAVMMLLFSIAGLGASILEEKESGTLKRLLISPIDPIAIVYGKMLTGFIVSMLQLIVMFLFAWIVFGLTIATNIPALVLMLFTTAFACSSFGIFLSSISKTRKQVEGLSSIIILTMSAIGGSMVPLFVMPEFMQKIAVISLNYWAIQGFYDIFWRSLPLLDILPKMEVLTGIGIIMSSIAVYFFKRAVLKQE